MIMENKNNIIDTLDNQTYFLCSSTKGFPQLSEDVSVTNIETVTHKIL